MTERLCTCMWYGPLELLALWRRRVDPTVRRLLTHGHRVPSNRQAEVVHLIMLIELGVPEVTSKANWNRSHHLLACPCSPRRTPFNVAFPPVPVPVDTLSTVEEPCQRQ